MSALLMAVALGLAATSGDAGRILIDSDLDHEAANRLVPGASVDWHVDVSTTPGEPGVIDIGIAEAGHIGLEVAAFRCATVWSGSECPTGETVLRDLSTLPGSGVELMSMPDTDVAYLRLVVVAPDDLADSAQGGLRLVASGVGDEQDADGPRAPLEPTGSLGVWPFACAAVGALGAGAALSLTRAVRKNR